MDPFTYLSNADPAAIDSLYQQYRKEPASIDPSWGKFFEGLDFASRQYPAKVSANGQAVSAELANEFKVINLINGYRSRGHLFTRTNPVRERRSYTPNLGIENFGLTASDLESVFQAGSMVGIGPAKLSNIIRHLEDTYCQSVGVEYMYIRNPEVVEWIREKMESSRGRAHYSPAEKKQIFSKLSEAVGFENFLDKKFVGQKRFSLEGCEALIPALDQVISHGAGLGIREFVMGMAHRGRINVLANIFRKDVRSIFTEFEGKEYEDDGEFSGDVKYHLGYSGMVQAGGHPVRITLAPNPSHLEAVGPVVEGLTRAFAESEHAEDYHRIAPIIIHGDAAIAGQGVVYEVVQMSRLDGYKTGGTIHIVVNNQVGFTTNYTDARSSIYCTDVGKVTLSPVFHVNADDVEAVVFAVQLAMEFRQKFQGDVFIDLLGYRKYGHNEGDEPRFTQPILYKAIAKHANPRKIYLERLLQEGHISTEDSDKMDLGLRDKLQQALDEARKLDRTVISSFLKERWKHIPQADYKDFSASPETGVAEKKLKEIAKVLYTIPAGMKFFNKMEKLLQARKDMVEVNNKLDWGMAELLAYGSLLEEGYPIRFSGQDVERGTFSHRHAVLKIEDSEEEYIPLANIGKKQADFRIYNSLLSEYAVLGFDYGYSLALPDTLTIWEAQFGDFFNGAQIIVDQFISSGEDKWHSMSALTLFLPHGYEGQGAEHSSARIERFLILCAENNMVVVNPTTPANLFHMLRRQMKQPFRKPLIVFTPKSLLRHPRCMNSLSDLANGHFSEVIDDAVADPKKVKKLVFCSGKLYYDLLEEKESGKHQHVALVRLEQLYPFPQNQFDAIVHKYKGANLIWAQEEPENMGAIAYLMRTQRKYAFEFISRAETGSPATGSSKRHASEQKDLIGKVFG
jgi:2-oxoglutarate dehydrogenase E1 component